MSITYEGKYQVVTIKKLMDNAADFSRSHTNTVLDSYLSLTDFVYAKIQSNALKYFHKILYKGTYFELRPKFEPV